MKAQKFKPSENLTYNNNTNLPRLHICNGYRPIGRLVFRINLSIVHLRSNPVGLVPCKFRRRSRSLRRNRSDLLSGKCGRCVNRRRSAKQRLPPLSYVNAGSGSTLPKPDLHAEAAASPLSVIVGAIFPLQHESMSEIPLAVILPMGQ